MRILFDQGTPAPLRKQLVDHEVVTAYEQGWDTLQNGDLLAAAEEDGFAAFITTDTNLKYQQNLTARRIAILVLLTTNWPRIRDCDPQVAEAVGRLKAGDYAEIEIP